MQSVSKMKHFTILLLFLSFTLSCAATSTENKKNSKSKSKSTVYFTDRKNTEKHIPKDVDEDIRPILYPYSFDLSNLLGGLQIPLFGQPQEDNKRIVNRPGNRPGHRPTHRPGGHPGNRPGQVKVQQIEIDLCFFLGDDVLDSHIKFFDWFQDNYEGYKNYVNLMTLQATKILNRVDKYGQIKSKGFKLTWKGPWQRSHANEPFDTHYASQDVFDVANSGTECDMSIFMVFNNYTHVDITDGKKFSGYADGGACEGHHGKGFAGVVDQGYYDNFWIGPQILAHHILLLLTADVDVDPNNPLSRNCPSPDSLLYSSVQPLQYRDQCVNDKIVRSNIPLRDCITINTFFEK